MTLRADPDLRRADRRRLRADVVRLHADLRRDEGDQPRARRAADRRGLPDLVAVGPDGHRPAAARARRSASSCTASAGCCTRRSSRASQRIDPELTLVASFAVAVAGGGLIALICGHRGARGDAVVLQHLVRASASSSCPRAQLYACVGAVLLLGGLYALLHCDGDGPRIRACATSRTGAELVGIDVERSMAQMFAIGARDHRLRRRRAGRALPVRARLALRRGSAASCASSSSAGSGASPARRSARSCSGSARR